MSAEKIKPKGALDLVAWLDTVKTALGEESFEKADLDFSIHYARIISDNEVYEFHLANQ